MVLDPLPDDTDIKPLRDWDGSIMQPLEPVERTVDGPTRLQELSAEIRDHLVLIGCGILAVIGTVVWASAERPAPQPPRAPTSVAAPVLPTEPAPADPADPPAVAAAAATPTPPTTPTPRATLSDATAPPADAPAPLGQTVLFRGGPATGPWQHLGSVAELTRPDAAASARYAYTEFWADPDEENQPDRLWDEIVAEVAEQAVALGPPTASLSSDVFAGVLEEHPDAQVVSAYWTASWLDGGDAVTTYYPYFISSGGQIVQRVPPFTLGQYADADEAVAEALTRIRAWAELYGYGPHSAALPAR